MKNIVVAADDIARLPVHEIVAERPLHRGLRRPQKRLLDDAGVIDALGEQAILLRLQIGDRAHQIPAVAHAQVAPVQGQDETVRQALAPGIHDQKTELRNGDGLVHDQRFLVHERDTAPAAVDFAVKGPRHHIHEQISVDESDRDVILDDRQCDQILMPGERRQHVVVRMGGRDRRHVLPEAARGLLPAAEGGSRRGGYDRGSFQDG